MRIMTWMIKTEGTVSNDAITKHRLDTAMIDKHHNNQDIDLKDTYNVINSKQQTFNEINTNWKTLVCYEDVRDVFVSCKESVFLIETHLDMGNNYIYNVKTPINNDQSAYNQYVDSALSKKVNTTQFENVARQVLYKAGKTELDNYLKRDGSCNMTGHLQMNNSRIKRLPTTSQSGDEATSKDYVLTLMDSRVFLMFF